MHELAKKEREKEREGEREREKGKREIRLFIRISTKLHPSVVHVWFISSPLKRMFSKTIQVTLLQRITSPNPIQCIIASPNRISVIHTLTDIK